MSAKYSGVSSHSYPSSRNDHPMAPSVVVTVFCRNFDPKSSPNSRYLRAESVAMFRTRPLRESAPPPARDALPAWAWP